MPLVLETVGSVERDAILPVVAQWLIRLLLSILITKPKRNVRCQLVANRGCTAITLDVLRKYSAGIVTIFVEKLSREQNVVDDIPGRGMANVIQSDEVGIDAQLRFVSGRQRL